ncbi:hypothetical protein BsWGS_06725 [Bradybaena similaris]
MARRVLESDLLSKDGIVQKPMGPAKSVEIVKEIRIHKTAGGVFSVQLNYTGELLAVGFGTGGVQLYETQTGEMVQELRPCRQGGFAIMVLRFHPKEPQVLYAGSAEGNVYVFSTKTGVLLDTINEFGNEINALDFCVDGYNFATGGKDLGIRVYETKTNKLIKDWKGCNQNSAVLDTMTVGNTMRIFCIKFHPNNQYIFVSGGWDNHLKIWDVRDNDGIKRNIRGPHICGDSIDLKENEILSGQWTALHALQVYNYSSGNVVRELSYPHTDGAFLYAAIFSNTDTVFAGGSGTNRAEVMEVSTDRHVGGYQLPGPVQALDSANQGRVLAVGGAAPLFAILSLQD